MKIGVRALFLALLLTGCAAAPPREVPAHREVVDAADSALPIAQQILQHLAAGDIHAAAAFSNAPEQRAELLRAYRDRVGESEFRRVFAEYASKPILREIAIGERRLLMWHLDGPLGAQYYVRAGDTFLMDDVPSDQRIELRRVLNSYRNEVRRK